MNSLMNYGSDGENSNDSDDAKVTNANETSKSGITTRRASDAIYDPVPMDMSEESNNNNSSDGSDAERSPVTPRISSSHRTNTSRNSSSYSDQRRTDHEERSSSSHDESKHNDKSDESKLDKYVKNSRHCSDKKNDDKRHGSDQKDNKDSKRHRDDDRKSRDNDKKSRDERRSRDKDRHKEKPGREDKNNDRSDRDHHRDDRRDRDRRDDRDRRRNRDKDRDRDRDREKVSDKSRDKDRDRRYLKDEKSRDRYRDDKRSRDRDRARSKSRSRSRSRDRGSHRPFSYREERNKTKLAQLEKLGIEIKATDGDSARNSQEQHYYNPLATATQGKYAEQIQKRKLLWANKKQDDTKTIATVSTANTWVGTTFTHDQDGKVTAKFKRLMGIKGDLPAAPAPGAKPDILKKQEEMFNNMEQQYEVARATTHTQRGVGLGYATGGFPFPR